MFIYYLIASIRQDRINIHIYINTGLLINRYAPLILDHEHKRKMNANVSIPVNININKIGMTIANIRDKFSAIPSSLIFVISLKK